MKALFTFAIVANAFLLFWVELFFAKRLLPSLGGAPAIWNTCLMFYQVFLLAGYGYAVLVDRLPFRRQLTVHGALIVLVLATLPWALFVWADPGTARPIPWLLALLTLSLGPTFFLIAAGAPLLQRWYSLSGDAGAADPYFLYAASNAGSFLALVAYPILLEPNFTLNAQEGAWKVLFGVVMLSILGMGFWALRGRGAGDGLAGRSGDGSAYRSGDRLAGRSGNRSAGKSGNGSAAGSEGGSPGIPGSGSTAVSLGPSSREGRAEPLTGRRRLVWVALAFLPSSLLLGVTTQITSEIAPVPLLWVVPLALYLLTYVVAFGPARKAQAAPRARRHAGLIAGAALLFAAGLAWLLGLPILQAKWLLVLGHLAALTAAGLICHGRIARDRPSPSRLTEFYLWIGVGGALGGVFNTLIAPVLFTDPLEYPLALAALAFVVASGRRNPGPSAPAIRRRGLLSDLALGAIPAALILFATAPARQLGVEPIVVIALAGVLTLVLAGRPVRFGLGVAGLVVAGFATSATATGEVVFRDRTFYGIHRIYQDGTVRWLAHGTTVHGGQDTSAPHIPLTYYHPQGPAGSLMAWFSGEEGPGTEVEAPEVAIIGLGTGSLMAYAQPGEQWSLYELDPTVVEIAEDPQFFTYLRDAPATYRHILGDARISLESAVDANYSLLVVDAFSSDAVPVHLLTVEAVRLYLERLAPDGVIAFHISNRYADFSGVVAALARELELHAMEARDELGDSQSGRDASHWALLSREPVVIPDSRWQPSRADRRRAWTDSYSSLIPVLRW